MQQSRDSLIVSGLPEELPLEPFSFFFPSVYTKLEIYLWRLDNRQKRRFRSGLHLRTVRGVTLFGLIAPMILGCSAKRETPDIPAIVILTVIIETLMRSRSNRLCLCLHFCQRVFIHVRSARRNFNLLGKKRVFYIDNTVALGSGLTSYVTCNYHRNLDRSGCRFLYPSSCSPRH